MPNECWSSPRSDASGTTIRSSVQTESKSSSSARLVRSSSSLTVTLSRKFGRESASFMRNGLLEVHPLGSTASPSPLDPASGADRKYVSAGHVAQFSLDHLAVV